MRRSITTPLDCEMTFTENSRESSPARLSAGARSSLIELDKEESDLKLRMKKNNLDDSNEDELRIEDISSSDSFGTTSDSSSIGETLGAGLN